jgi:lysophospholipase L1-like esterase
MKRTLATFIGLASMLMLVVACGSGAGTASPVATGAPTATAAGSTTPSNNSGPTASVAAPSEPASGVSAAPVPAGALTIVALGDSLTEGQGDESGLGGYPGRLQILLAPTRPGTKVTNVGHSGWSSTDLIDGQNRQPSELTQAIAAKPNVALVWIGSNDLWNLYEYGPEPMAVDAEQADLQAYETNIDKTVHELASHGATVFIALLDDQSKRPVVANPPIPAEPAFPATTRADLALMSAHVRAYNDIIRHVAAQYGAGTVDFFNTTIFTDPATLYDDGNHPNNAGYDRIAQIWLAALNAAR